MASKLLNVKKRFKGHGVVNPYLKMGISMVLVSQKEFERKVHSRASVEGLWKVVQVACMNEKRGRHPQATRDSVT